MNYGYIFPAPIVIELTNATIVENHISLHCLVTGSHVSQVQWQCFGCGFNEQRETLQPVLGLYSYGQSQAMIATLNVFDKYESGAITDLAIDVDNKYRCLVLGQQVGDGGIREQALLISDHIRVYCKFKV